MKFQAFLLWGTDDSKPPEGKAYKPVDPDIRQKLKELPLKWTHWFEVNRKDFAVTQGAMNEVSMSEKCQVNVKKLAGSEVEVFPDWQGQRGDETKAVPAQRRDAGPGRQRPQFHRLAGRLEADRMRPAISG